MSSPSERDDFPIDSSCNSDISTPMEPRIEKVASIKSLGVQNQIAIEIVDTTNNEHYMLLVNSDATLQTIEPQIRVFLE